MRVPIRLAATLLVAGACSPNPAFKIAGESNDGGASSGDGTTIDDRSDSSADSGAAETGSPVVPCEPTPVQAYVECGAPLFPFSLPNMTGESMFDGVVPCGTSSDIYVKRVSETALQQCPKDCVGACEPSRSLSIVGFNVLEKIDELLPQPGECARLWHVSEVGVDGDCKSVGYAFWDVDGDRQLRLAASADLNPFTGVTDLPIDVSYRAADNAICEIPGITLSAPCMVQSVEALTVNLAGCEFLAPQTAEWTDIPFGGRDYKFSSSSYACVAEVLPFFSWYLRRAQP